MYACSCVRDDDIELSSLGQRGTELGHLLRMHVLRYSAAISSFKHVEYTNEILM